MVDKEKTWIKQNKESIQAYEAFKIYLDLGVKRSIRLVSEKTLKNINTIAKFSKKYSWIQRVRDFDRYMSRIELTERENKIIKALNRHADIAELFQTKASEVLNQMNIKSFEELSPLQLIKLFEISINMDRTALGIPLVGEEVRLNQAQDKLDIQRQIVKDKNGDGIEESSGFLEGIENIGKNVWKE